MGEEGNTNLFFSSCTPYYELSMGPRIETFFTAEKTNKSIDHLRE
jgi:hypothetical protein